MELCDRLKALRIQNSMTQRELGISLNVSELSIRNWETGAKKPSMAAIISIARVFNVTTDYLLGVYIEAETNGLVLNKREAALLSNYRTLDKYGKKLVETLCLLEKSRAEDNATPKSTIVPFKSTPSRYIPKYITPAAAGESVPLDGEDFEMILIDESVPLDADFAVRIQGDSMYPYINDGDTVYVKKNCELSVGDVGLFCVDGAIYCKQYFIDSERNLVLVSANPALRHTNIFVSFDSESTVKCYGKILLDKKINLTQYLYE